MTNKHFSQPPSALVRARLNVLLEKTNSIYSEQGMILESDITSEYHSAVDLFVKSLEGSVTGATSKILAGQPVKPAQIGLFFVPAEAPDENVILSKNQTNQPIFPSPSISSPNFSSNLTMSL